LRHDDGARAVVIVGRTNTIAGRTKTIAGSIIVMTFLTIVEILAPSPSRERRSR
jgi:hypothetical protein